MHEFVNANGREFDIERNPAEELNDHLAEIYGKSADLARRLNRAAEMTTADEGHISFSKRKNDVGKSDVALETSPTHSLEHESGIFLNIELGEEESNAASLATLWVPGVGSRLLLGVSNKSHRQSLSVVTDEKNVTTFQYSDEEIGRQDVESDSSRAAGVKFEVAAGLLRIASEIVSNTDQIVAGTGSNYTKWGNFSYAECNNRDENDFTLARWSGSNEQLVKGPYLHTEYSPSARFDASKPSASTRASIAHAVQGITRTVGGKGFYPVGCQDIPGWDGPNLTISFTWCAKERELKIISIKESRPEIT